MNHRMISLLLLLGAGGAAAADRESTGATPQARRRLDPSTFTAVVMPAPTATTTAPVGTTVMDRYVVAEPGLVFLLKRPPAVADPKGKFNWKDGGRFARGKLGPFDVEVGLWTHIDILADDDKFTGREMNQKFDILRIKW